MLLGKVLVIVFFIFFTKNIHADIPFFLEIRNITVNGGLINIGYYTSQEAFSNQRPDWYTTIESTNETIIFEIRFPAAGEYMIGIHQDSNGNRAMDYGLFGIPREPYGFSNLRGRAPGNFNQLKFKVTNPNEKIIIPLVRF